MGVGATSLYQGIKILVDSTGVFDTGLAIAKPADPADHGDEPVRVFLSLWRKDATFVANTELSVPPLGHIAKFVGELFPDLPETLGVDISEFEGYLLSNSEFIAPLALRSASAKLTSTPTLAGGTNGFAPVSTVEFAQTLAGTSPGLKWMLHQNDGDFALESVKISAPDLDLNLDGLSVGDRFAVGYLARGSNSRVFEFILTKKGSLEFDTVIANSKGLFKQGSGRMDGTPTGGLTLELTLDGKKPFTKVGEDGDQSFYFLPGIVKAPAAATDTEISAEFTSVSSKPDTELPLRRRTTQKRRQRKHPPGISASWFPKGWSTGLSVWTTATDQATIRGGALAHPRTR